MIVQVGPNQILRDPVASVTIVANLAMTVLTVTPELVAFYRNRRNDVHGVDTAIVVVVTAEIAVVGAVIPTAITVVAATTLATTIDSRLAIALAMIASRTEVTITITTIAAATMCVGMTTTIVILGHQVKIGTRISKAMTLDKGRNRIPFQPRMTEAILWLSVSTRR